MKFMSIAITAVFLTVSFSFDANAGNKISKKDPLTLHLCSKGTIKKITLRSWKGIFCTRPSIAQFVMANCKGIEAFEKSKCFKKAEKAIKKLPRKALSTEDIIAEIKEKEGNLSEKEKKLVEAIKKAE